MSAKVWSLSKLVAIAIVIGALVVPAPALAKGNGIYPAEQTPNGWTLAEAAKAKAHFNTGSRDPSTLPADFPFQILYVSGTATANSFSVNSGTKFYVPVLYSDDSQPPFPADVTNQTVVAAYFYDPQQYGAVYIRIKVDDVTTDLSPAYAAGAVSAGLPDGGNNYAVVAAFLQPLSKGTHTIIISSGLSGAYVGGTLYEFPPDTYTVIVH